MGFPMGWLQGHSTHGWLYGVALYVSMCAPHPWVPLSPPPMGAPLWILTPPTPGCPPMDSHPPPMGAPPPSAIRGSSVPSLLPADPTQPSALRQLSSTRHVLLTAETHNFPTGN